MALLLRLDQCHRRTNRSDDYEQNLMTMVLSVAKHLASQTSRRIGVKLVAFAVNRKQTEAECDDCRAQLPLSSGSGASRYGRASVDTGVLPASFFSQPAGAKEC